MTTLAIIDPTKEPAWDAFVEGHPLGQIYHLSGWKRILEDNFKHIKGFCLVLREGDGREIRAGMPVYKVSSWMTGRRLVSMPFATLSDPLVSDAEQADILMNEVIRLSGRLRCPRVEIRTVQAHPFIKSGQFGQSRYFVHHFLRLDKDLDSIRSGFHRTCVRQRIAKAEKSDIELRWGHDESALKEFYRLLILTRKRNSLPAQPYSFIKSLWDVFFPAKQLSIMLALKNGVAIAALMLLKHGDRVSAEFAVSDESFNAISPMHLLFWQAIRTSREEGYKIFDFGRTSPRNKSLMDFKNRWGTQAVSLRHFYHPPKIAKAVDDNEENWRYRMIRIALSVGRLDPLQKMIGAFCYRHLG